MFGFLWQLMDSANQTLRHKGLRCLSHKAILERSKKSFLLADLSFNPQVHTWPH